MKRIVVITKDELLKAQIDEKLSKLGDQTNHIFLPGADSGIDFENDIIIANGDNPIDGDAKASGGAYVLTYGLSMKCTLTASSITEDNFVCCLQRSIASVGGKIIAPQEFTVKNFLDNIHSMLAVICVCLVYGDGFKYSNLI